MHIKEARDLVADEIKRQDVGGKGDSALTKAMRRVLVYHIKLQDVIDDAKCITNEHEQQAWRKKHKLAPPSSAPRDLPRSEVTVQVMSADTPLSELLRLMLDQKISHCEIPHGEEMFVHIAMVFDRVESSKLTVHLDKVTLAAIDKANARKP